MIKLQLLARIMDVLARDHDADILVQALADLITESVRQGYEDGYQDGYNKHYEGDSDET